jgi:hypothetical protein
MRKIVLVIILIAVIAGAVYLYKRLKAPKVDYESIDWLKKTVHFKMSVEGEMFEGMEAVSEYNVAAGGNYTIKKAKDGVHEFVTAYSKTKNMIQLAIVNGTKVVVGLKIDFKDKSVTPLTEIEWNLH